MLTKHIGMDMLGINVQVPPDQAAQARRIQRGARADHAAGRDSQLPGITRGDMRHHIDRIGCDQQNGIRRILKNIGDHLLEHLRIPPQQLKPRLARLLSHPRRDDHHLAAGQVRIISGCDLQRMRKRHRMENIIGFRFGPRPILIDQYHSPPHPAHHQRVRSRRADKATSHNTCFHLVSCFTTITKYHLCRNFARLISTPRGMPRHRFPLYKRDSPAQQHTTVCCTVDVPAIWIGSIHASLPYRSHPPNNR